MENWSKPYEVTIEVENLSCKILNNLKSKGLNFARIVDVRGLKDGVIKHLISFDENGLNKISWFESEGCDICKTIIKHGTFLVSGKSLPNSIL